MVVQPCILVSVLAPGRKIIPSNLVGVSSGLEKPKCEEEDKRDGGTTFELRRSFQSFHESGTHALRNTEFWFRDVR